MNNGNKDKIICYGVIETFGTCDKINYPTSGCLSNSGLTCSDDLNGGPDDLIKGKCIANTNFKCDPNKVNPGCPNDLMCQTAKDDSKENTCVSLD